MTSTYVLKRLLEHGPLTRREIEQITGWPRKKARSAIQSTVKTRVIQRRGGQHRSVYEVAA